MLIIPNVFFREKRMYDVIYIEIKEKKNNVLKIGQMIKSKKLSIHGSLGQSMGKL